MVKKNKVKKIIKQVVEGYIHEHWNGKDKIWINTLCSELWNSPNVHRTSEGLFCKKVRITIQAEE